MSEGKFHRTGAEISVDYSECDRAAELRDEYLMKFPDRPLESSRRDFDFAIFGSLLGSTFGVILSYGEMSAPHVVFVVLTFALFGGVSGYCLDCPRNRYRRTGNLQFGIGDIIGLMAVIALGL